jgi:hypothetical protein
MVILPWSIKIRTAKSPSERLSTARIANSVILILPVDATRCVVEPLSQ